ncbi:S8 family serine peptidase [Maribacter sp. 2210JD10-5]|uniref:S8 family serine peptidase n=1 Tax=Maribacter sp. 2210JD10-5 TaxID=3386272 RepID=UPI0039BD6FC2
MDYQKLMTNRKASPTFLLVFFLSITFTWAQSEKLKSIIDKEYDFSKIGAMQVDLEFDYEASREKTLKMAKSNHWKVKEVLPNGKRIELQDVGTDGTPLYYETYSDNASQVSRADKLHTNGAMGLDINGSGMQIGVWDAGVARATHQEYDSRVTIADGSTEIDPHATMVTGSMISAGIKKEAKGVAYAASVISHDWTRDKLEAMEAAANGLLVSNHSYGIKTDRVPDWYFGSYIKVAQDWDKIMFNAPYYLMVTAAGNARNSRDNESPIAGNATDGFDLMLGFTLTKNGITVAGADTRIDKNGELKKATVSSYSSFGPVDDGRIKPDLAGDGSSILSTHSSNNTSYNVSSGTSMATPGVTGSLLLLQQYNEQLYGSYLRAATLKGLALHTADDVDSKGPDYKMGWGVMNTQKAAKLLLNKEYSTQVTEDNLEENETIQFEVEASGDEALIASISWTDPESEYLNRGVLNDKTAALVNDLDIRVTKNGTTFYPWTLNPASPNAAAVQGDNKVDPFERIEVSNADGIYTITISHKGTLKYGAQDFSLLVSGVKMTSCNAEVPENLNLTDAQENGVHLNWEGTADGLFEVQYKNVTSDDWRTTYVSEGSNELKNLVEGETYTVRLRTFCTKNLASEYTPEYEFTFEGTETTLGTLLGNETLSHTAEINFSVFPNPAVDVIQFNTEFSDTAMYRIVTATGAEMKIGMAKNAEINVSDLATGLYIIQIQDFGMEKSTKFYKN